MCVCLCDKDQPALVIGCGRQRQSLPQILQDTSSTGVWQARADPLKPRERPSRLSRGGRWILFAFGIILVYCELQSKLCSAATKVFQKRGERKVPLKIAKDASRLTPVAVCGLQSIQIHSIALASESFGGRIASLRR